MMVGDHFTIEIRISTRLPSSRLVHARYDNSSLIPINDVETPASGLRTSYLGTHPDAYWIGEEDLRSNVLRQKIEAQSSDVTLAEAEGGIDRSLLNMVHFYGDYLQALLGGETSLESISLGTRKRFIASGVVRKFGSVYELTEIGSELLHHTRT